MITADDFADWGPNISKVHAPLKILRKAIPMPTLEHDRNGMGGQSQDLCRALHDLGNDWRLKQLETIDENLFDVISDIMDEKRQDYQDFLDGQSELNVAQI